MRDGSGFHIWVSGAPLEGEWVGLRMGNLLPVADATEGVMLDSQNSLKGSLNYNSARQ